jgi:hypothetical protein
MMAAPNCMHAHTTYMWVWFKIQHVYAVQLNQKVVVAFGSFCSVKLYISDCQIVSDPLCAGSSGPTRHLNLSNDTDCDTQTVSMGSRHHKFLFHHQVVVTYSSTQSSKQTFKAKPANAEEHASLCVMEIPLSGYSRVS